MAGLALSQGLTYLGVGIPDGTTLTIHDPHDSIVAEQHFDNGSGRMFIASPTQFPPRDGPHTVTAKRGEETHEAFIHLDTDRQLPAITNLQVHSAAGETQITFDPVPGAAHYRVVTSPQAGAGHLYDTAAPHIDEEEASSRTPAEDETGE